MRRLLIAVLILVGLLIGLDRGGAYAASQVADAGARSQGAGQVNVRILGFPS